MNISKLTRSRLAIALNYLSVILTLVLFECMDKANVESYSQTSLIMTWGTVLGFAVWFVSFYKIYWKTKWWQYVHLPFKSFDEREKQAVSNAIRIAYGYFSVLVLLTIWFYIVLKWEPDFLVFWVFLYLAHVLPASLLKWQGYKI